MKRNYKDNQSPFKRKLLFFLLPLASVSTYMIWRDKSLSKASLILVLCTLVCSAIIYISYYSLTNPVKKEKGITQKYEKESAEELFKQLKREEVEAQENFSILWYLRKRVHESELIAIQLVKFGIVQHLLQLMPSFDSSDKRIVASIDLLNEIFAVKEARIALLEDEIVLKDIINSCFEMVAGLLQEYRNMKIRTKEAGKEPTHEYKLLITLGSLGSDFPKAQTRIGDQQGIKLIIRCMAENEESVQIITWGLWSLFNLTLLHPPNKADLVLNGGVQMLVDLLQLHVSQLDIVRQTLAVLVSLISNDSQAKFSISQTRHALLEMGLVDILDDVKREFKDEEHIKSTSKALLNIIIKEWS